MSVQTNSGGGSTTAKGSSLGPARVGHPATKVNQTTRHAGKTFDRLHFSTTNKGPGMINLTTPGSHATTGHQVFNLKQKDQ